MAPYLEWDKYADWTTIPPDENRMDISPKVTATVFVALAVASCVPQLPTVMLFPETVVGYSCSRQSEEAYGRVSVGMQFSVIGRFERGSVVVRLPIGPNSGDAVYTRSEYMDVGLSEPRTPYVLQVARVVLTPVALPSTLILTLDSGEQVSEVGIDAARLAREGDTNAYVISVDIKDQKFIAAFEKANSFALDVIDIDNKHVVHEIRTMDQSASSSAT
ncbi:MAG: hypothetical protein QOF03_610, partial [Alphaproteobacteria bacterium]|nr:hypothetical protein [Alphaproteobacteria bacterium]